MSLKNDHAVALPPLAQSLQQARESGVSTLLKALPPLAHVQCTGEHGDDSLPATTALEPSRSGGEELRIDPADGNAYTLADFIAEYNGMREWQLALPVRIDPADGNAAFRI